jgi:ribonuclease HI
MNLDPSEGVAIFTDGSASNRDKSGGWGWVALDAFEGIYTGSGYRAGTTISRMELAAPTYALEYLNVVYGACDVLVYSDSEYVVLGVNDRTRKRNANKGWWLALDLAIEKHNIVQFHHVKGHSDHLYNEMADDLAGKARKEGKNDSK